MRAKLTRLAWAVILLYSAGLIAVQSLEVGARRAEAKFWFEESYRQAAQAEVERSQYALKGDCHLEYQGTQH